MMPEKFSTSLMGTKYLIFKRLKPLMMIENRFWYLKCY